VVVNEGGCTCAKSSAPTLKISYTALLYLRKACGLLLGVRAAKPASLPCYVPISRLAPTTFSASLHLHHFLSLVVLALLAAHAALAGRQHT